MGETPNYITPTGLEKLKSELKELLRVERPQVVQTVAWAAGNGDRSENGDYIYGKRRLREIDRRIRFLTKRIEGAQVVDPSTLKSSKVVFGATVAILDEDENRKTYRIVGEDEAQPEKGWISWRSPIATALLGKSVGDDVKIKKPGGEEYFEILDIAFHA